MATQNEPLEVSSSDLKNSWYKLLERVSQGRPEVVITRYGHPIARLSPYEGLGNGSGIFGFLAGAVTVHSDITAPVGEAWEADA